MSAGISLMYKNSGGCDKDNICGKCGYLETNKTKAGAFYYCTFHRNITGEDHLWKTSFMACRNFIQKGKPRFKESKDGQLSLF